MIELEKSLKDLDSAIAEIKEIDRKVKARVKSAVLDGDKIEKVLDKALMAKIPDTPEKTIEHVVNCHELNFNTCIENPRFEPQFPEGGLNPPGQSRTCQSVKSQCQDTRSTVGLQ
ncbi:hypothetical protein DSO57_1027101 [Entomophthora muscae]|uniref:Uncharacterized protein n=1 Tax=Entomophthora muscae TaxID=34485 RepID=A0ACC2SQV5_9FUNG|nr:hypothetical protein DSO57_1027101 [Entomophthora muscae]